MTDEAVSSRSRLLVSAVAQSGNIIESMRDEFLAPRVLGLCCVGEELNEILRLGSRFRPGFSRCGQKKFLKLFLTTSQSRLIILEFEQALAAKFSGFHGGGIAALVEVDRVIRHLIIGPFFQSSSYVTGVKGVSWGTARTITDHVTTETTAPGSRLPHIWVGPEAPCPVSVVLARCSMTCTIVTDLPSEAQC